MHSTVKKTKPIDMYYVIPEAPMMSSVIDDCPDLEPDCPDILDKSTPVPVPQINSSEHTLPSTHFDINRDELLTTRHFYILQ